MRFERRTTGVTVRLAGETLRIDAWGADTLRVRGAVEPEPTEVAQAVVSSPTQARVEFDERTGSLRVASGSLCAVVERSGRLTFEGRDGVLLGEPAFDPDEPPLRPHRWYPVLADGRHGAEATFAAHDEERFYGLGQHTLGRLDLKGCVVDLWQRNSQVAVPALVSSRGYGLLWNSPAVGRVELGANHTRWVAHRAAQLDYVVYAGETPADVLRRYHDLTGYPPPLPRWASGYWQSNSYYTSQDELLSVAREHLARDLPLTAMFVDYMHWTRLGEWEWDAEAWPDPAAMVAELDAAGVRLMVAVWPHVSPRSKHFGHLHDNGLLVGSADGGPALFSFADREAPEGVALALLDLSNPAARRFYWERIEEGYHRIGVRAFWLDACEPELTAGRGALFEDSARYHLGHGTEVSSMYPLLDAQAVREGLDGVDDTESMLLVRSAWAGSQRYGAAVWSGDVQSTWESLRLQVGAGLNMMVSGIPWWTSDIGGFFGADRDSDDFRELLVRWFQFAVFWPVLRMHGNRHPDFFGAGIFSAGGPNEVWSFGEPAYQIMRGLLAFRERLRPYLHDVLDVTASEGTPPVRPMWFQHPDDVVAVGISDQFLLGPDLLVAPVTDAGVRSRKVYLPDGSSWRDPRAGTTHDGGRWVNVEAPIDVVPVFVRVGGALQMDASWFVG
ncbi:TIM-barrel domain-containing protein [Kineosporia sp. A_224]|uniref:glycoside hydrolase family 31 protein n=1 Tax=Kineosporia sp. A_224 TaxID=1962180 RepID=UPI000B4B6A45|nr:TIM-barrel domain-containing protein [Kineosporia sp. A_224]